MKPLITASLFLLPLAALAASPLQMTGPDSAKALYANHCSNGANIDEAGRAEFLRQMLADPRSKVALLKAQLLKEITDSGDEPRGDGVYFGPFQQTYHDRDGCGESYNSYTMVVATVTGGNSNLTITRDIVTVDDDDREGVRTLTVRSIQPLSVRDRD